MNENYLNAKGFLLSTIKNVYKENNLPSRFSQRNVNQMVRAAAEEVWFFTTITVYFFITAGL